MRHIMLLSMSLLIAGCSNRNDSLAEARHKNYVLACTVGYQLALINIKSMSIEERIDQMSFKFIDSECKKALQ